MTHSLHKMHLKIWQKFCFLIDGMAIGSTVFALRRYTFLQALQNVDQSVEITELLSGRKVHRGYLYLAFRLLEDQGFVVRRFADEGAVLHITCTSRGRLWLPLTSLYDSAMHYLRTASVLTAEESLVSLPDCPLCDTEDLSELEKRIRLHVAAPLVAAFLVHLYEMQIVAAQASDSFKAEELGMSDALLGYCLCLLKDLGWVVSDGGGRWTFTEEGKLLSLFIPQLFYPVSYINTSLKVPDLIFPDAGKEREEHKEVESHIDRSLDIRFSGLVYERNFREPVHSILYTLFNTKNIAEQPRYIVDIGSGDGTLLLDVYRTISEETLRGHFLEAFPLIVVGVEYNRVAEEATADRLRENNVPFFTVQGDIGQPEKIAEALKKKGIALDQVLHISKSVIHNRIYSKAVKRPDLGGWIPRSDSVFIDEDGTLISSLAMAENLVDFFHRWRVLIRKHGMLVIEAHSVAPGMIAASIGENILTFLDSSHGYSHQYLVEKEFFYSAVQAAGYTIQTVTERAVSGVETPVLTVNYLRSEVKG